MYNVNPFDLIISEPIMDLNGESIHKVIGFEIEVGEELILFHGTYGECTNFICSVENNALVKIRHYHKLMDKIAELTSEIADVKDELREQEEAYDRLLADYDDLGHQYQYEVDKNEKKCGKIDCGMLLKIATGKPSRCDAIRLLVKLYGLDFDEARRYVNKVLASD